MNSSEFIVNSLEKITLFGLVKWMFVGGLVMYVAFSVIIVKQVGVMTEAIEDDVNGVILMFAWAHLLLAIALVILAVAVL